MSLTPRRPQSPAAAAALPIIDRLSATIEAENRDLEQGRRIKYEAYSLSKNQGLLELNRLIPELAGAATAGPLHDALAHLHANLEINRRALAVHLNACEALPDLTTPAIQDLQCEAHY